ncbi:hypothetical protein LVDJXP189_540030 [Flavobacterium psychrophilum]|nr:hypothetical protein LVDJXP189_540030 [Flavobacterium psychrophilum]
MAKQKIKKMNKPKSKKPITAYTIIRAILITLACIILILGIVGRIHHFFNNHQ